MSTPIKKIEPLYLLNLASPVTFMDGQSTVSATVVKALYKQCPGLGYDELVIQEWYVNGVIEWAKTQTPPCVRLATGIVIGRQAL